MSIYVKILLIYFVGINLIALLMYGLDKRYAIQQKWRIPEKHLIGIAIAGGSIGAIAGMKWFHHKTLHGRFRYGLPCILGIQISLIVLYLLKGKGVL